MPERPRRRFTPEEYLLIEERAETKSEYCDGEIFAMSGATLDHNRIVRNLVGDLHAALRGTSCEVLPSDLRVHVKKLYTYPDVVVVCGPPKLHEGRQDTIVDATLVIEVLSPSTAAYDRGEKFRHYRGLPSFTEYLLVAQDEVCVVHHQRQDRFSWIEREHTALETTLSLPSIGVKLPMSAIYYGVFPKESGA